MTTEDPFAKSSGSADMFTAKDHVTDLAIVFEFKRQATERNPFYKSDKPESDTNKPEREVVFADVACFRNSEDVATATPSLVKQNVKITNGVLVLDVERNDWMGKTVCQVIRKVGQPFVYRDGEADLTPEAKAAATKWFLARKAELDAVEVPGFEVPAA